MSEDERLIRISKQKNKLQGWLNEFEDNNALDLVVLALTNNFLTDFYLELIELNLPDKQGISGNELLRMSIKILRNEILRIENVITHDNNAVMQ